MLICTALGANRLFPSSLVHLFQSECKCETILMKMTLVCMKMKLHAELIFMWKIEHLDSFWNRGTRELGNGLLDNGALLGRYRRARGPRNPLTKRRATPECKNGREKNKVFLPKANTKPLKSAIGIEGRTLVARYQTATKNYWLDLEITVGDYFQAFKKLFRWRFLICGKDGSSQGSWVPQKHHATFFGVDARLKMTYTCMLFTLTVVFQ